MKAPMKTAYLVRLRSPYPQVSDVIVNLLHVSSITQVTYKDENYVRLEGPETDEGRHLCLDVHSDEWELLSSLCINTEAIKEVIS